MFIKRTPVFLLAFIAAVGAKEIVPTAPSLFVGCYRISTAEELYGFAEIVNGNDSTAADTSACGELTKDIVVNESVLNKRGWLNSDSAETLAVWQPIKVFSGTFNGNGYVISGLFSPENSGLFESLVSSTEQSVVVRDLGIVDSYFSTKDVAGVLAESVSGDGEIRITNFYSLSVLEATRRTSTRLPSVGGVVGYVGDNTALTLKNCYSAGNLVDNKNKYYSQLLGYTGSLNKSIKVDNCYVLKKGSSDNGTLVDSAAFRNGAVAFLLRENTEGAIWGQDVGEDSYPIFSGELKNSIAARYNVSFHTFDGDTAKYFDDYVAGIGVKLPKGTSRENLVFGGWYRNAEFSGENDTAISNTTTGDLEFWARMYDRYKVTYHSNGGNKEEPSSYLACGNPTASYQDALIVTDSVACYLGGIGSRLDYTYTRDSSLFVGWYDNEELTGYPVNSIKSSDKGDKDLYAKWFEYKRPAIDPADSCYIISNAEELYGFSALVDGSFTTGKYNKDERLEKACGKLTKDIVVNENVLKRDGTLDSARMHGFLPWNPVPFSSGTFDGQGHSISGLYINGSGGVFYDASPRYYAKTITIRNLKVKDSFISNDYDAGGIICSHTRSTAVMEIENTHFDGAIYVQSGIAGGLVSEAHNLLIIKNSSHRGIIWTSSADVGGIVGHIDEFTVLVQNYNEGSIIGERPPVDGFAFVGSIGGLVGEAAGNFFIANNYNVADIKTTGSYGGLIGDYYVGSMGKCEQSTCRPELSYVLNNYSKGQITGDWPAELDDSDVTFENNFYLDGTLPKDSIGTPVQAEAFEDGTVAKALHDYVLKDSTGAEVAGGVRGDNWIQGDEYPVFSGDEKQYLVLLYLYTTGYMDMPSNVLFHTPGQVLPLPTPSMYGYSFAGWKLGDDIVTEIPATVSEDLSVSAKWSYLPSSSSSVASSSSVVASSSSEAKSSSSTAKSSSSSAEGKSSSSKGNDAIAAMDHTPQFSLMTVGRRIQVSAARVGAGYAVLDLQGGVVMQGRVGAANFNLDMPYSGAYLVRIGHEVQKVTLK